MFDSALFDFNSPPFVIKIFFSPVNKIAIISLVYFSHTASSHQLFHLKRNISTTVRPTETLQGSLTKGRRTGTKYLMYLICTFPSPYPISKHNNNNLGGALSSKICNWMICLGTSALDELKWSAVGTRKSVEKWYFFNTLFVMVRVRDDTTYVYFKIWPFLGKKHKILGFPSVIK